jgi:hypothetical protein
MRTLKSKFVSLLAVISGISFMLIMLMLIGCSKNEGLFNMTDESPDALLKSTNEGFLNMNNKSSDALMKGTNDVNTVLELTGTTHFPSYAVKEHRVISPWELNVLDCNATLIYVGGQDYVLETEEYMEGMLFRRVSYDVKLTPGGSLNFSWPDEWEEIDFETWALAPNSMEIFEQFLLHTGCIPYGPDKGTMFYKGKFDGQTFYASAHFMAKQVQSGIIPFYATGEDGLLEELINGPIQFDFSIELEVME